ncbi:MAG: Transposase, partial [uncultured Gemmatimonadaceae bacterium]
CASLVVRTRLTCPMPSGRSWRPSFHRRSAPVGRGSGQTAQSRTPCSTCCGAGARGGCCPTRSRRGPPSSRASGAGASTARCAKPT